MHFEHDELLLAIQATAQRVGQDHAAAPGARRGSAGRAALVQAGLLDLVGDRQERAGEAPGHPAGHVDELGPEALCVALYALAQWDTGLALFTWAQNVAASAAGQVAPELSARFRAGEPVAVPLDLELEGGSGVGVSCGAARGLVVEQGGWRLAETQPGSRTSVGVDGADIGSFGASRAGESVVVAPPDVPGAVAALASIAAAVAERAARVAGAYATERHQFGHPIADFQALRFMLADARTGADAARLLALAAASRFDLPSSARALHLAAAAARGSADAALQVHGGAGYTRDYVAEALLRDANVLQRVARARFEASALAAP